MTAKPNGQDLHTFAASATEAERQARASLRPLLALKPYLLRYKVVIGAALAALIVSAAATLVLPLAVRRMIDVGFSGMEPGLVDKYFATLLGIGL
ncbi:MAG TPA: ABC transporter, partial [Methyloceanibacter sp.]|nr:ABC transporter [Methyloceanibacter sp.]